MARFKYTLPTRLALLTLIFSTVQCTRDSALRRYHYEQRIQDNLRRAGLHPGGLNQHQQDDRDFLVEETRQTKNVAMAPSNFNFMSQPLGGQPPQMNLMWQIAEHRQRQIPPWFRMPQPHILTQHEQPKSQPQAEEASSIEDESEDDTMDTRQLPQTQSVQQSTPRQHQQLMDFSQQFAFQPQHPFMMPMQVPMMQVRTVLVPVPIRKYLINILTCY